MKGNRNNRLFALGLCLALCLPVANAAEKVVVLGLFSNKAMIEVDGKRHMLSAGESTPSGVKLISANSDAAELEINGEQRKLSLGTQISGKFSAAQRSSVSIWPTSQGMYTVDGYIDGYAVSFLVDTGATIIAMNHSEARRLEIDYLRDGKKITAETASGVVPAYHVKLRRVSVGTINLYDVAAVVIEGQQPSKILLGMSFLSQLEMKHEGEALILKQKF